MIDTTPVLPASYPIRLGFEPVTPQELRDARNAVYQEYEAASQWKRLHASAVEAFSDRVDETVFVLKIDHLAELDWTLEGAEAFRPLRFDDIGLDNSYVSDSSVWSGKIIEFDEAAGEIYVDIFNPRRRPRRGDFIVKPFEFLRTLNEVYNGESFKGRGISEETGEEFSIRKRLAERLAAAQGNAPYAAEGSMKYSFEKLERHLSKHGIRFDDLKNWWGKSWSILWGPPGTGKTYTTGSFVASLLADEPKLYENEMPPERILVVSTTNQAVDSVAVAAGKAARRLNLPALDESRLVRIGKGCRVKTFESDNLLPMLEGTDTGILRQIQARTREIAKTQDPRERAMLRKEIDELRSVMQDAARRHFIDANKRIVFCTAFAAVRMLVDGDIKWGLEHGNAPFTTVVIDEAGLIPRTTTAALSLLASRRVVLVGDSKQLSPISKISRILPPNRARWIASSGLDHLETISSDHLPENVQFLKTQYRMHPEIGEVISSYQYSGKLEHDNSVQDRPFALHRTLLEPPPRAVWVVLDDEKLESPQIRSERGSGNRSWVRHGTQKLLERFFSDSQFAGMNGLFISPFLAQAREVQKFFARNSFNNWTASTVHSQQGQEADVVIFDTVNAGSHAWPRREWTRMINVGLSRAKEMILLLASRDEMREPYLSPLLKKLVPCVHRLRNNELSWQELSVEKPGSEVVEIKLNPQLIGAQILERQRLRPVLSQEQQRLCGYKIDGKQRLVRGVAGSGKTAVLAEWLVRAIRQEDLKKELPIWIVYANTSLHHLLQRAVDEAWKKHCPGEKLPDKEIEFLHIHSIVETLAKHAGLPGMAKDDYDYNKKAAEILETIKGRKVLPRCRALFIDEAQDMGPKSLELLFSLAESRSEDAPGEKPVCIFYDNAQNVYNTGTPNWKQLGLDMRGRASVMKESFRSTKIISEYAINVLYKLKPDEIGDDHKELVRQNLLVPTQRSGADWWSVRFNQIDGPMPEFKEHPNRDEEFRRLAEEIVQLIDREHVPPSEIRIIANGLSRYSEDGKRFDNIVAPIFNANKIDLLRDSKRFHDVGRRTVVLTTPHSFKGFDAEVVFIPAADRFVGNGLLLANPLYVAMTRARSLLKLSAVKQHQGGGRTICDVLRSCLEILKTPPVIDDSELATPDEIADGLSENIGTEHKDWLEKIQNRFEIVRDPIYADTGEVLAEPLFFFSVKPQTYACFGKELPADEIRQRLESQGIKLLQLGESIF